MKCTRPITLSHGTVGCGQCLPCRVHKRREWTGKLIMESLTYAQDDNLFCTFTYNEENIPPDGSLNREHGRSLRLDLRDALRRQNPSAHAPRFFWVGEYGDESQRPHYHAILFGCGHATRSVDLEAIWGKGYVQASPPVTEQLAYCASYCVKKLTRKDDYRLGTRHPEYAQMSRRPALGDEFIRRLADWYTSRKGSRALAAAGDVTHEIRYNGKKYPLGQRHKRLLRSACGLPEKTSDLHAIIPPNEPPEPAPDAAEIQQRRNQETRHERKKAFFASARKRL